MGGKAMTKFVVRDKRVTKLIDILEQKFIDLRKAFEYFDVDKTGKISKQDFNYTFKKLGLNQFSTSDIEDLFSHLDKQCKGYLLFEDWRNLNWLRREKIDYQAPS